MEDSLSDSTQSLESSDFTLISDLTDARGSHCQPGSLSELLHDSRKNGDLLDVNSLGLPTTRPPQSTQSLGLDIGGDLLLQRNRHLPNYSGYDVHTQLMHASPGHLPDINTSQHAYKLDPIGSHRPSGISSHVSALPLTSS